MEKSQMYELGQLVKVNRFVPEGFHDANGSDFRKERGEEEQRITRHDTARQQQGDFRANGMYYVNKNNWSFDYMLLAKGIDYNE